MGCIRDILRSRVVDLAPKNQSPQSPEFPIFRSSLVPSVADYFRQCIGDKSATLESGHILFEMLDKKTVWKTSKFETFGNLHPTNKKTTNGNVENVADGKGKIVNKLEIFYVARKFV